MKIIALYGVFCGSCTIGAIYCFHDYVMYKLNLSLWVGVLSVICVITYAHWINKEGKKYVLKESVKNEDNSR